MVSDTWYAEIESTIFTYLQYHLVEKEDAPFPMLNCTTSSQSESIEDIVEFPTLYVHLLPPVEIGNNLENKDVPAIRASFELQVFSNKSETECRKLITACIQLMKSLSFNIPLLPDPQTSAKKYFAITRCSRVIASGDSDIVPRE